MAKTHLSLSHDPALIGAPTGFTLPVRELRPYTGAGWIVAVCGDMQTMPGLPAEPAALRIDLDGSGRNGGAPMSTLMEKASEPFGLEHDVVDEATLERTRCPLPRDRDRAADLRAARRSRRASAEPCERSPASGPTSAHPLNLFRVHWFNGRRPARAASPCPSTSCCRAS